MTASSDFLQRLKARPTIQHHDIGPKPFATGEDKSNGDKGKGKGKGVGVNIVIQRQIPKSVFKKPSVVSGFNTAKRQKKEEFKKEQPVENADPELVESGAAAVAAAASVSGNLKVGSRAGVGFGIDDKRHVSEGLFDREMLNQKLGKVIIAPVSPFTSSSASSALAATSAIEKASDARVGEDESAAAADKEENAVPLKLKQRAKLVTENVNKVSPGASAMAVAQQNEDIRDFEVGEEEKGDSAAPSKFRKINIPNPRKRAAAAAADPSSSSGFKIPVSTSHRETKAQIKKRTEKAADDAARDDKYALVSAVKIGDTIVNDRLPAPRPLPQIQASEFYMNNRAKFIQYINALFQQYRKEMSSGEGDISCEALYGGDETASVSLLLHQKIVRDYLNIYSPYRGLLLFHGLGSGKTCSSIAIAEGLKTFKKIVVMTPASLRMNYMEEMKTKCGDLMYKKNQFWEFISTEKNDELVRTLAYILKIDASYIRRHGGAWLVNVKKPSNYETLLTPSERVRVDQQIDEMIKSKYEFINYNGLRNEKLKSMSDNYTHNPFDNCVIVIDEAHNFVSRIVNKLKRPTTMAFRLYDFLLRAQNAKVVLLTGTPIINYPNEIAVLFNILRGNIDTWVFTISHTGSSSGAASSAPLKLNIETFKEIFGMTGSKSSGAAARQGKRDFANNIGLSFDNMEYNTRAKQLIITRNPFGFVRDYDMVTGKYKGVIRKGSPYDNVPADAPAAGGAGGGGGSSSGGAAAAGQATTAEMAVSEMNMMVRDTTSTENGIISDAAFEKAIIQKLNDHQIFVVRASTHKQTPATALPSTLDEFNSMFIEPGTLQLKNRDLLIRRILGLTSYFRSAQESLLPAYDAEANFHLIEVEMSDHQFAFYSRIRDIERNQESQMKKNAKKRGTGAAAAAKGKKGAAGSGDGAGAGEIYEDVSSTYRIFSRAFCNFVFPTSIHRPLPNDGSETVSKMAKAAAVGVPDSGVVGNLDETPESFAARIAAALTHGTDSTGGPAKKGRKPKASSDAAAAAAVSAGDENRMDEDMLDAIDNGEDDDDDELGGGSEVVITGDSMRTITADVADSAAAAAAGVGVDVSDMTGDRVKPGETSKKARVLLYKASIAKALRDLKTSSGSYLIPAELATYSPKFLYMLNNIHDPKHIGLHLVYSQFRTLEGIGVFKIVLETNGFSQFKIKQSSVGDWTIDMSPEEQERPCFALYTGTESSEEKEIIRNIFNSKWKNVPKTITDQLSARFTNNMYGEVIKVLMITASGSEGINLRNVRYVHVAEPYWHPVRTEQIIGRARRICSHHDLPEDLRTVDVFLYVMRFSGRQMAADNDDSLNIRMNDKSKTDNVTPLSTDQSLYETSNIKARITKQILTAVKESSFDCMLHANTKSKEKLNCYSFGVVNDEEKLAYKPDIKSEEDDKTSKLNKTTKTFSARLIEISGKQYAEDPATHIFYDLELYNMGNMVERGRIVTIPANPKTGETEKRRVDWS